MKLNLQGPSFLDEKGRTVLLRGVNLGGSSKIPAGEHPLEKPHEKKTFTFVGRPFPLSEADEHFRRLRHWGFNTLRLLTTWEAIEPLAPGEYDEAYLDYFSQLVKRAATFGFYVFVDPHQDAWSRFSGGDGAPRWTLELAGFNVSHLDSSEAALTLASRYPDYPMMVWPNNWGRLASATLFTLFFGGDRFAPKLKVGSQSIQTFLQTHFIQAMTQVAKRLCDFDQVLGYDSLNEPNGGYLGVSSLSEPLPVYHSAPELTGFQSLFIPAGIPTEVPWVERQGLTRSRTRSVLLNPNAVSAWLHPEKDVWRNHGVWDFDGKRPVLLKEDYFSTASFIADGLIPFASRYATAMRQAHPGAWLFLEGDPGGAEPLSGISDLPVVNASHWYDLLTLTTKHYDPECALTWGNWEPVTGKQAVKTSFAQQIAAHATLSREFLNGCPTLIGEFGLPMDLDGGQAFRDGDFSKQEAALSEYYNALDANLIHSTIWNYTSDNDNQWGDQWNQEDLSLFSRSQQSNPADLDSGARGLKGFCRPSWQRCPGVPRKQSFDLESGIFYFEMESHLASHAEALFYFPEIHYPQGAVLQCSAGKLERRANERLLIWKEIPSGIQWLRATREVQTSP